MRRAIGQRGLAFDIVLSSPSARTRETLALIGIDAQWEEPLYLAEPDTLLGIVRALPEAAQSALVVGHNPGLHELVLKLARADADKGGARSGGYKKNCQTMTRTAKSGQQQPRQPAT
jgi:phosphohistidine phosphatase